MHRVKSTFRLQLIASIAIFSLVVFWSPAPSYSQKTTIKTISLILDYGNGFEKRYTRLRWSEDMTALDATRSASKHKQGFQIQIKGSGATAFVTSIDDVENEGQGKNWMYRVNGKKGDRSSDVFKLRAGDEVKWTFEVFDAD